MRCFLCIIGCLCLMLFMISMIACDSGGGKSHADDDLSDDDATDDDTADDDVADDDADLPIDDVEVQWFSCSLHEGQDDGLAECAETEMHFNWFDDDGRSFTSYAKRLLSSAKKSEGQLWLLHGGPGASGTIGLTYYMEYIQDLYPELDLYTLDPRGTGYSDYAGCPDQETPASDWGTSISPSELDACIAYLEDTYGDDLAVFNTTNSAIDLAAYIAATKKEGEKVMIWGGSGGTHWGQRYLQLFPDQADGIIMEGIVPPVFSLVFQDEYADKVAHDLLDMCAEDAFCGAKLPDPKGTLLALYDKLDGGHCGLMGVDSYILKQTIDYLIYYYPHHATVPALIYRLDRCNAGDMAALIQFFDVLFGGKKADFDRSFSEVLFFNEGFSEMWEYPTFSNNQALLDYLDGIYEDPLIGYGKGYDRNDIYLKWPRYVDELEDTWAVTDIPMLMLQGIIDPSTPYDFAVELEEHFAGALQHFVAFPYAPHNVADGTPVSDNPYAMTCGRQLFLDFLHDPTGELDTSCVAETLPPDFEGIVYGPAFFGTPDYWENPTKYQALEGLRTLPPQYWFRGFDPFRKMPL